MKRKIEITVGHLVLYAVFALFLLFSLVGQTIAVDNTERKLVKISLDYLLLYQACVGPLPGAEKKSSNNDLGETL